MSRSRLVICSLLLTALSAPAYAGSRDGAKAPRRAKAQPAREIYLAIDAST